MNIIGMLSPQPPPLVVPDLNEIFNIINSN